MKSVGDILKDRAKNRGKYITREWQDYGMRLAHQLNDLKNKSLYIKLAKTVERRILEQAAEFVKDALNVKSKPRLFMWKMKELKIKFVSL
jgi:hypothetical protein